jgi:hypothetical protein
VCRPCSSSRAPRPPSGLCIAVAIVEGRPGGPPDLVTTRLECWMRGAPAGSHQAGTILATKDSVPSRWAVGDQVRSPPPMTHVDCCCYGI